MNIILKNAVGCADCAFLPECGGLPEKSSLFDGCYSECMDNCNPESCHLTCPNNQRLYVNRIAEIGGSFDFTSPALKVPAIKLPPYVTKIHNGSGREKNLRLGVAVIPIRELLRKSGANISCRFADASQVRRCFRLPAQAAFVISCISVDGDVEMAWRGLMYGGLSKELAKLKPAAIIVPNFSFFIEDVPRIHTLYNRKRICMAARMLSEAGCRIIAPLNANTAHDWDFWYKLLQENPAMKYVAKEFQTGLSAPAAAKAAIESLAKVQERLGRPLHPVALGAFEFRDILSAHFKHYTIVDSRPFMLAVNRRRTRRTSDGSYEDVFTPTAQDESIDEILQSNIRVRQKRLKQCE